MSALTAVIVAEWTKIRTVRSSWWALLSTFVVAVGISALVGASFRTAMPGLPDEQQRTFDPLFATFYSLTLSQLALVVFGVLVVSAEYTTGTIRASLIAVPRRGRFYAGKVLVTAATVAAVAVVTVPTTFVTAQAALGPYATSAGADGVPTAMLGSTLYLVLIALFAVGVTLMLRSAVRALVILLPLLFLGSQGIGNVPVLKPVMQYLPDQAGMVIMHISGPPDDPRWARAYDEWTGLGIVAVWTAAALVGGYLVLTRRDA